MNKKQKVSADKLENLISKKLTEDISQIKRCEICGLSTKDYELVQLDPDTYSCGIICNDCYYKAVEKYSI